MKVFAFLANGFEETEAVATIDVLRRAEINVITVSISNSKTVTGAHGIPVIADEIFAETDFSTADLLFLPGGMPGTKYLGEHEELKQLLLHQVNSGKKIAAICAAPTVLAKIGILDNKEAICYPGFESDLTNAVISTKTVVKSGNVITGKGPGVTIPFALEIVEELKGKAIANKIAADFCFE
jgi:DJ-1 family protein